VKKVRIINRRQFGAGAVAAALSVLPTASLLAQTGAAPSASPNPWAQLGAMSARARQLGLSVPRMTALGLTGGTSYDEVMPAVVDFIDHIKRSAASSNASQSDVDALLKQASALLMTINDAERSPHSEGEPGELGVQISTSFESLRDGYVNLFNSCVVSDAHRAQVAWYVGKLTDPDYDEKYDTVEDAICVPWYFTGILHAMEASFNFDCHLHNGDPLDKKTVHVPAGRPPVWLPPSDWPSSAEDALSLEGFANQTDWSLARTLYRMEAYNGFGSRRKGINTPYLWAFSNHYTKGKYVADGRWDPSAVSTQCGGAVMLKALITSGRVASPS
jgi:lysozyme family protein